MFQDHAEEQASWLTMPSPIGPLLLLANQEAITGLYFKGHKGGPEFPSEGAMPEPTSLLREASRQVSAYFEGGLREFDLPLDPQGPPFHQAVWKLLLRIPFGETRTYGSFAQALQRPGGSRAVGAGSAKNPISLIIPCHRLVGAQGSLTGYAGGLDAKSWLLHHEKSLSGLFSESGHASSMEAPS